VTDEPVRELDVLLPVHNEADSIEGTVREIQEVLAQHVSFRFVICEDGSVDGTKAVLTELAETFPMKLVMSDERKGYSRAVVDGMKASDAPYLLCLDSDGQCDPKDFPRFWAERERADVVIGRRVNRQDTALRRAMSRSFYVLYQLLYRVPVKDPSCPFVLARHDVVAAIAPRMREMQQGFWWEFVARVHRGGCSIVELPVNHRLRSAGETQIYRLRKLPGIGFRHAVALGKIWYQTR
jgi:dolichol-phosphate mannosyltransferase